jgi:phosphopantetheinyl transferase
MATSSTDPAVDTAVRVSSTSIAGLTAIELVELTHRLPQHERDRAAQLRTDAQRRSFVIGRLLLRSLVAGAAEAAPDDVRIDVESAGRPVVVGALSRFSVSIAHSGDYVVAAVAQRAVGVDVEQLPSSPRHPGLVARVCSPDELRHLEFMTGTERERAFMAIWARKEAYGKARGVGLDFDLRSITACRSPIADGDGEWQVSDLDIDAGYAAAVVARGVGWRLQLDDAEYNAL